MGINDRLDRVEDRAGPEPCARPAPCQTVANTELILRPDGTRQAEGSPPPPLCSNCPEPESSRRRIRHVQVVRDLRNRHHGQQVAPRAALWPTVGHDEGPEEYGSPETTDAPTAPEPEHGDGLPASWPRDHPARLALEGRESPPRRRSSDASVINRPEDFGIT